MTHHIFKDNHPGMGNIRKFTGRQICINCGLLRLHNPVTDLAVKLGCDYKEDPRFRVSK